MTFFRDRYGHEADAVVQAGQRALLVEAKSGETVSSDAFDGLDKVAALLKAGRMPPTTSKTIVYGGHERWTQRETTVLPWGEIDRYDWLLAGAD